MLAPRPTAMIGSAFVYNRVLAHIITLIAETFRAESWSMTMSSSDDEGFRIRPSLSDLS